MYLSDKISFGKYKGLTIKEVYQGKENINKELLKAYLLHKFETIDFEKNGAAMLKDLMHFEISTSIMRVTPAVDDYTGNWSKTIEELFQETVEPLTNTVFGNVSLNLFNISTFSKLKSKSKVTSGFPDYIEWCILNVDEFYIYPESLLELMEMDVYRYIGIKVIHKVEDIYTYEPEFLIKKFNFSSKAIEKNLQKQYTPSSDLPF